MSLPTEELVSLIRERGHELAVCLHLRQPGTIQIVRTQIDGQPIGGTFIVADNDRFEGILNFLEMTCGNPRDAGTRVIDNDGEGKE